MQDLHDEYRDKKKKLPVVELFGPTIQGEGGLAGEVTGFLRLGGCPLRCEWCDSMHAVDPNQIKKNARYLTQPEIIEELSALGSPAEWLTITGGDPVMHDLTELVNEIGDSRVKVAIETEGYLFKSWLRDCTLIHVSPKGPSSGMLGTKYDYDEMKMKIEPYAAIAGITEVILKVVIFTEEDYKFARQLHRDFPSLEMYLSIGTRLKTPSGSPITDEGTVKALILRDMQIWFEHMSRDSVMADCHIFPQLHVLAWGTRQGV